MACQPYVRRIVGDKRARAPLSVRLYRQIATRDPATRANKRVYRSASVLQRHVRLERCSIARRVIVCGGRHSRSCTGCALPWRLRSRLGFEYN